MILEVQGHGVSTNAQGGKYSVIITAIISHDKPWKSYYYNTLQCKMNVPKLPSKWVLEIHLAKNQLKEQPILEPGLGIQSIMSAQPKRVRQR